MNVLTAAWIGTESPAPTVTLGVGSCARCASTADLVPARSTVSPAFTGYDDWVDPSGAGLCPPCTWGYRNPALRSEAHLVTRRPATLRAVTCREVHDVLTRGALGPDLALVVPLRPGRKHVLPTARWGRVTVEDTHLPWSARDAALLKALTGLRRRGFGTRMLIEAAPPFAALRKLPRSQWAPTMRDWALLEPWREPAGPWLALALHITRTITKETR